ncbi:hypothetical protein ACFQL0_03830 [Haloplanus litoreus]|uniref:hypothetical protein n=1 Tax=Haloplanus litoreus TaxID=767515 RepID=UPI003613229D
MELTHRRRREAVRAAVARVDATLLATVKYGVLVAFVSVLTVVPPVREALPVVALAGLVASSALRGRSSPSPPSPAASPSPDASCRPPRARRPRHWGTCSR